MGIFPFYPLFSLSRADTHPKMHWPHSTLIKHLKPVSKCNYHIRGSLLQVFAHCVPYQKQTSCLLLFLQDVTIIISASANTFWLLQWALGRFFLTAIFLWGWADVCSWASLSVCPLSLHHVGEAFHLTHLAGTVEKSCGWLHHQCQPNSYVH